MPFDFRKKVATNVEILKSKAAQVQAYGINIDTAMMVLIIFANVEHTQQHKWGREFRPAMQTIRAAYPYTNKHNDASLDAILKHLAAADSVRALREAPKTNTEAANAVSNEYTLLQQMMQEAQAQANDYEENAFAAAQSDSDSSTERSSHRKKKSSRCERDRGGCRDRSRGSSRRYHSHSRRRDDGEKPKNSKKYRPRVRGTQDANKCFYNKAYKGYIPLQVCGKIGMVYKKREKFPTELGGYSDSEGDSDLSA
jgi:hypothetical protein